MGRSSTHPKRRRLSSTLLRQSFPPKPSPGDNESRSSRRSESRDGRDSKSTNAREPWHADSLDAAAAADAMSATLSGVAADVKKAIKTYEQSTSLPYDVVPPEVCCPTAGSRAIDLSGWSLLVDDTALKRIAMRDRDRIDELARGKSVQQVGNHIEALGLSGSCMDVSPDGVVRFEPSSMVAWRERQTLGHMKAEEYERAQVNFAAEVGLTALDVSGAEGISDGGVAALVVQCRQLQSLDLSGACRVTDVAIRTLALSCTGLTHLSLQGCSSINGPGLAAVGESCPKLTGLDLTDCKKIGQWVLTRIFRGCHELSTLCLARCPRVGDEELKELGAGCHGLTKLDLTECIQVSDTGLLEVGRRCSALTTLELSRSKLPFKIGDVTLLALGEGCPGLQRLNVSGCDGVTDVGLAWMSNGCPALEHLTISGCFKVTNAGVTSLSERCPLLLHLGMARLKHVTDPGVARLGTGCLRLRHLDMSGFVNLSDGKRRDFALTGMQALTEGCTELEVLILDRCFQIAKVSLWSVGTGLPSLRRISLAYCPALTLSGISAVAKGCPLLRDVNLSNCGGAVTDAVVTALARGCRMLQRLSLKGIVGVPPPLGAPGILSVCDFCRGLVSLDLRDVRGLEDIALAGFHERQMPRLEQVNLMNCLGITGVGVQWLAEGCPALSSVNVQGTKATLTSLNIISERYPYCRIKVSDKFIGLAPLRKAKERKAIKSYAALQFSARKIQGCFRARRAREEVQGRRVRRAEEKAAGMVSRVWRKRQGRTHLEALRRLRSRTDKSAVQIQTLWRKAIARMLAARIRSVRADEWRCRSATNVQRMYRGTLGRVRAKRQRGQIARIRKQRAAASLAIQQRFRMHSARRRYRRLREAADRLHLKRDAAARVLETRWRSYRARQQLEVLKRLWSEDKARRQAAAMTIQKAVRASRCRKTLLRKQAERAHRHASATTIQRHYRGSCARVVHAELCARRQVQREKGAAVKLQCWHRLVTSKALLAMLSLKQSLRKAREWNAAKTMQQFYRRYRIRLDAEVAKQDHEDEVRAMSRLEEWAATRIQSFLRGVAGRARATARRLEHMGRWREVYDEERGAHFYYSKITGEIRWRRPQDFLELLPRPSCGDCTSFEAFCECADCEEFFCSACYKKVHAGGKRLRHNFRALYDYYGRRMDYGEGEFPSRWPTDIAQAGTAGSQRPRAKFSRKACPTDDQSGWRMRVSPEREALEERGSWSRYASDGDGSLVEDPYYHSVTGESMYQPPVEWSSAGTQQVTSQPLATAAYDEDNSDWSYPISQEADEGQLVTKLPKAWESHWDTAADMVYYYNTETGESTYHEPQEDTNEDSSAIADGVDDGVYSAAGNWIKYYDKDYAVDYYFSCRTAQTQYERPPDFCSPRGERQALGWSAEK